jgi:O-antigen/teichoic acid export membrane protein
MSVAPAIIVDSGIDAPLAKHLPAPEITFSRSGLFRWGRQSAISLLDQGLTSAAAFGINVLLARWLPSGDYGAFAVVFAGCLFISGYHNVLLLEPLSVIGPSRYAAHLIEYFRAQVVLHFILIGILSAGMLIVGVFMSRIAPRSSLASAALGGSLALPFLLLLWLARRMCYVAQRPAVAVVGSASHLCLIAAGMFLLHRFTHVSAFAAFLLVGCSSSLAACVVLIKLGLPKRGSVIQQKISWLAALQQNWIYGRWLTLTTLLSWVSVQAQVFLTASFLGLTSAGILRAMQLPSFAITQVISATTLLVLPSLARDLGQGNFSRLHRKAVLTSFFLTSVGILFAAFLFFFSGRFERVLYGERYKSFAWLIPLLALAPVFTGFCSSYSYALRALGKAKYELLAYVLSACTAVLTSVVLVPRWGLPGAITSIVLTTAVLAAAILAFYKRWGVCHVRQESLANAAD